MKRKHARRKETAEELMARLQSDPEWVRRDQERERKRQQFRQELLEEQKPLLEELATAGWRVESVWDLVNTSERYPEAVPVLLRHLGRPYHPRIREGIARALTVPEARGQAGSQILDELKRSHRDDEGELRWVLINALMVVAEPSIRDQIDSLLSDQRFEADRVLLQRISDRISPKESQGKTRNKDLNST